MAKARLDVVDNQLPKAFDGLGAGIIAGPVPLPPIKERTQRLLARIDQRAARSLVEEFRQLGLSIPLRAFDRIVFGGAFARACAGIKFDFPATFAAPSDVSAHLAAPSGRPK